MTIEDRNWVEFAGSCLLWWVAGKVVAEIAVTWVIHRWPGMIQARRKP